jgi:hypothetical protein
MRRLWWLPALLVFGLVVGYWLLEANYSKIRTERDALTLELDRVKLVTECRNSHTDFTAWFRPRFPTHESVQSDKYNAEALRWWEETARRPLPELVRRLNEHNSTSERLNRDCHDSIETTSQMRRCLMELDSSCGNLTERFYQ